jgi:hypothetical protein
MKNIQFNLEAFGPTNAQFVLRHKEAEGVEDGKPVYGKAWTTTSDLIRAKGKYGAFLVTPNGEGVEEEETYFINMVKEIKNDSKTPVARLQVKDNTGERKHLCALFLAAYEDGTIYLRGKDRDSNVQYRIYANAPKVGNGEA